MKLWAISVNGDLLMKRGAAQLKKIKKCAHSSGSLLLLFGTMTCLKKQNSRLCLDSLFLKAALKTSCSCPRLGDPNRLNSSLFKGCGKRTQSLITRHSVCRPTRSRWHTNTNFGLILLWCFNWPLSAASLWYVLIWIIPLCWNPLKPWGSTAKRILLFPSSASSSDPPQRGQVVTQHLGNRSLF